MARRGRNVFQVHGLDAKGNVVLRKVLKRRQVLEVIANRAPSLIGMEACAGAHYWARELGKQGHEIKLISPQFVKPYVKGNKNDATKPRRSAKPSAVPICLRAAEPANASQGREPAVISPC